MRVQTREGVIARDALLRALEDLDAMFEAVKERFVEAYEVFKSG